MQSHKQQKREQTHSHGGLQQLKSIRLLGRDVLGKGNGPPVVKPVKPVSGCGSRRRLGAGRLLRGRLSWLGYGGWAGQVLAAGAPGLSPAAGMRHLGSHKRLPPAGSGGSEQEVSRGGGRRSPGGLFSCPLPAAGTCHQAHPFVQLDPPLRPAGAAAQGRGCFLERRRRLHGPCVSKTQRLASEKIPDVSETSSSVHCPKEAAFQRILDMLSRQHFFGAHGALFTVRLLLPSRLLLVLDLDAIDQQRLALGVVPSGGVRLVLRHERAPACPAGDNAVMIRCCSDCGVPPRHRRLHRLPLNTRLPPGRWAAGRCGPCSHLCSLLLCRPAIDIEAPEQRISSSRTSSRRSSGGSMGFNWKRADAWRSHPLLTNTWRHSMPGFGLGLAAFAFYAAYDQLSKPYRLEPKEQHH